MRIVFRADGNSDIGLGHVIRSLALVAMLKDRYECVFAIQSPDFNLLQQIKTSCSEVIILPITKPDTEAFYSELLFCLKGDEIVVLDGYNFNTDYQRRIKTKECRLVCIDDIQAYHFISDVVINHTGGIDEKKYSHEPYTKIYIGPDYVLLRQPFFEAERRKITPDLLKRLLICMGGSDSRNITMDVLGEAVKTALFEEIYIITGSGYHYVQHLDEYIAGKSGIVHLRNIDATKMVSVMQKSGAAVCSPSSVCYEYLSIGGVLFLRSYADNQLKVKEYLLDKAIAFEYDRRGMEAVMKYDFGIISSLVNRQMTIFDGRSAERFRDIFKTIE